MKDFQLVALIKQDPNLWDQFINKGDYMTTISRYEGTKSRDVLIPKVSEHLLKHGYNFSYPEGKKFAICLTHDVDDIYPPLTHKVLVCLYSLKKLDWSSIKKHLFWKTEGKQFSPYINFKEIIDIERKYKAKSSFYFITTAKDPRRFRYNIEDITEELSSIAENGWEIGLHGGYFSFNDIEAIRFEKHRLEKVVGKEVIGYRNHYLRLKVPDTWSILERCGFKYDTTYGYTNMVGFRNGMCHAFRPYNISTGKLMDIYQIPLHLMDGTLFDIASSFDRAWDITKNLIDTVEKYQGFLTVLWHNNVFSCPFRNEWKLLYEKILQYGSQKNAWMTSAEEIWRWWQNNGYQTHG
ncbi:MAG: hypothetical protein APF76_12250 [Desulfitibacter sp. BRH_c19]|nr:MAG: hypothetical protein APF76_12250 [Desulfitibacter sp. BRH_c19]